MKNKNERIHFVVKAGLIAALYAVLTYVASLLGMAYMGVQFRISEALTVLPVFTPAAIPGLVIGCFLGNLGSPFGMVDVICGTMATLVAALFTYGVRNLRIRNIPCARERADRGVGSSLFPARRINPSGIRGLRRVGGSR